MADLSAMLDGARWPLVVADQGSPMHRAKIHFVLRQSENKDDKYKNNMYVIKYRCIQVAVNLSLLKKESNNQDCFNNSAMRRPIARLTSTHHYMPS